MKWHEHPLYHIKELPLESGSVLLDSFGNLLIHMGLRFKGNKYTSFYTNLIDHPEYKQWKEDLITQKLLMEPDYSIVREVTGKSWREIYHLNWLKWSAEEDITNGRITR